MALVIGARERFRLVSDIWRILEVCAWRAILRRQHRTKSSLRTRYEPLLLSAPRWVDALCRQFARIVASGTGISEADIWEDPKSDSAEFIGEAIIHPPLAAALWRDEQIQAALIGQLIGFVTWLGLGHGNGGKWHEGISGSSIASYPRIYPQIPRNPKHTGGRPWTRSPGNPPFLVIFSISVDTLGWVSGAQKSFLPGHLSN